MALRNQLPIAHSNVAWTRWWFWQPWLVHDNSQGLVCNATVPHTIVFWGSQGERGGQRAKRGLLSFGSFLNCFSWSRLLKFCIYLKTFLDAFPTTCHLQYSLPFFAHLFPFITRLSSFLSNYFYQNAMMDQVWKTYNNFVYPWSWETTYIFCIL